MAIFLRPKIKTDWTCPLFVQFLHKFCLHVFAYMYLNKRPTIRTPIFSRRLLKVRPDYSSGYFFKTDWTSKKWTFLCSFCTNFAYMYLLTISSGKLQEIFRKAYTCTLNPLIILKTSPVPEFSAMWDFRNFIFFRNI